MDDGRGSKTAESVRWEPCPGYSHCLLVYNVNEMVKMNKVKQGEETDENDNGNQIAASVWGRGRRLAHRTRADIKERPTGRRHVGVYRV